MILGVVNGRLLGMIWCLNEMIYIYEKEEKEKEAEKC